MNKIGFLREGDKIVSKKIGRWTYQGTTEDGYLMLAKIRKGLVTETFKCLPTRFFS